MKYFALIFLLCVLSAFFPVSGMSAADEDNAAVSETNPADTIAEKPFEPVLLDTIFYAANPLFNELIQITAPVPEDETLWKVFSAE